MKLITAALVATSFCYSCGKKSEDGIPFTVPLGLYDVGSRTCVSTDAAPIYPDANAQINFYEFSNLSSHQMEIRGGDVLQTFQDDDCKITMERKIGFNGEGVFSFRKYKNTVSEPENCTIQTLHDETTFPVDASHPALANDDSLDVEILYEATASEEGQYILTTRDEDPDRTFWNQFGCAVKDQFRYTLTPPK